MAQAKSFDITHVDFWLVLAVLLLITIGTTIMYSASSYTGETKANDSEYFLQNHLIRFAIGLVIMVIAAAVPYQVWLGLAPIFYGLSMLSLLFLLSKMPPAFEANGSWRWLRLGSFMFQPSDFARYALIMLLARLLVRRAAKPEIMRNEYFKLLIIIGLIVIPVALEKDLGTAIIIAFIALAMFYFAEINGKYLFATITTVITAVLAYLMRTPYQMKRVIDFVDSIIYGQKPGWQVNQSLVSFAQGGFFGQGIGGSRQKFEFLPEAHKDFIFSILGEEAGFIGTIFVLVLYGFLLKRSIQIAKQSPDQYGVLLGGGIAVCIGSYALINIAVTLGLLPTTGIPLPFFSYGGSSLISHMAAIGLLINISSQGRKSYANYFGWNIYQSRLERM